MSVMLVDIVTNCDWDLPYILAYKSKNLGQVIAGKTNQGSTYMQVNIVVSYFH